MVRHKFVTAVWAALFFVCASAAAVAAEGGDPSGTWKWTFSRGGQDIDITLELTCEGEMLLGDISLPNGRSIEIKNGKFTEGNVSFQTVFERNGNKRVSQYKGKLDGDTITGTIERERDGEAVKRDWQAKRDD